MRYAIIMRAKPNLTFGTGVPRRMQWSYAFREHDQCRGLKPSR